MIEARVVISIAVAVVAASCRTPRHPGAPGRIPVYAGKVIARIITPENVVRNGFPSGIPRIRHLEIRKVRIRRNRKFALGFGSSEPRGVLGCRHRKYDHIVGIARPACEIFRPFGKQWPELPHLGKAAPSRFGIRVVRSEIEE